MSNVVLVSRKMKSLLMNKISMLKYLVFIKIDSVELVSFGDHHLLHIALSVISVSGEWITIVSLSIIV